MDKAMIFAAGLGTRLQPLTNHRPKALVELAGKSLLQRAIDKLTQSGIRYIVVNIHHFSSLMLQGIEHLETRGAQIVISDETNLLLDTGGGLLKAAPLLRDGGPFLAYNVDIVSDIDLQAMLNHHNQNNALATLAVSQRITSRYFLWDENRLCGWENKQTGAIIRCFEPNTIPVALAFSGIHIIDPTIFKLMKETGVFSINRVYLRLAAEFPIVPFIHDPSHWADVGTLEKLQAAEKMLSANYLSENNPAS